LHSTFRDDDTHEAGMAQEAISSFINN